MASAGAYRSVLAIRDARLLITASAASQLGNWLYNAALLAYVYIATESAAWVGAATICRLLPYVLLAPIGGVIADRYNKRSVLIAGDALRAAAMFALAAVVAAGGPIVVVIGLTVLASAAGTAERPATMAMLPRMVGETRLGPANALLHTVQDLGVIVGPAIGAVLLTIAPSWVAFVVNGATFVVSAVLISLLHQRSTPSTGAAGGGARAELSHGIRTVRHTGFVVPLFVIIAMAELTYGAQTVQLVLYAQDVLDLGASGYGYLLAAAGVGGLLSILVNARLSTSPKVSGIAVATGAVFCATQLAYAGVSGLVLALVVTVIGGLGLVACEVVVETTLARIVPNEALGRVMGIYDSMAVAAMVSGALLAPLLIDRSSLRTSLVVLGLATLLVTLLSLAGLRGLNALSRQRTEVLASRVAIFATLPLAAGAPRMVIEELAAASQVCPLPPGVDVVAQGAPAHAFYVVMSGQVLVHRDGHEVVRLGPGEYFGERGLLDNAPRNATVTTTEQSTLMRTEGDVLIAALEAAPAMRSVLSAVPDHRGTRDEDRPLVDDPRYQSR
jgi:MFS family permease